MSKEFSFPPIPGTYRTAQEAMVADLNAQCERIVALRKQLKIAVEAIKMAKSKFASMDRIDCDACALSLEFALDEIGVST